MSARHTSLGSIGLLLCALACTSKQDHQAPLAVFGKDGVVERGLVERVVVVDGQLYSPSSRPLAIPQIRWYWDWGIAWAAAEGIMVKSGDVVVKLDISQLKKDLTERNVQVEQQRLELEEERIRGEDEVAEAKSSIKLAELDLKKKQLMVTDSDAVSEAEKRKQKLEVTAAQSAVTRAKERVSATLERSKRRIEMMKLKLDQAEEELADMKAAVGRTELKAPQDGLLIFPQYNYNNGWMKARAGGGARTGTEIAEVANPSDLVARLYIPEIDADGIGPNVPGLLRLDVSPGETFSGKVRRIATLPSTESEREGSRSVKPADNVRQFEVQFELAQLPKTAMPGMTAQVVLHPLRKPDVLRVPTEALATAPVTDDNEKPKTLAEQTAHVEAPAVAAPQATQLAENARAAAMPSPQANEKAAPTSPQANENAAPTSPQANGEAAPTTPRANEEAVPPPPASGSAQELAAPAPPVDSSTGRGRVPPLDASRDLAPRTAESRLDHRGDDAEKAPAAAAMPSSGLASQQPVGEAAPEELPPATGDAPHSQKNSVAMVEKPTPLPSGTPSPTAWIYMRGKDDKKWQWRQVRLGVQSLTHAEIVEGLAEGDHYKTLLW